jgi:glutamate racemase
MNLLREQPIGIFDSGVGGLTVASAIHQLLPNEQLIYFGDTAHLPYGDKSKETVSYYSEKISEFLLEKKCKVILIACNTASANAYNHVKSVVGEKAIIINVIDPVVEHLAQKKEVNHVGVIGTKGTINSQTYPIKIKTFNDRIKVSSLATPLLVPMIEEGFIFDNISNAIIHNYLSREDIKGIDLLILGCTHYPIIKNQISKFYNFKVDILDSAKLVASYLHDTLSKQKLLSNKRSGTDKFYVSDYTDYFKVISRMFFDEEIKLEKLDLWK